jgi:hypothetical protein
MCARAAAIFSFCYLSLLERPRPRTYEREREPPATVRRDDERKIFSAAMTPTIARAYHYSTTKPQSFP